MPLVNFKAVLVVLVRDAEVSFGSEEHHVTSHEVKHHVVKRWFEGFLVYLEKVNVLVCNHLNSLVSFDVINAPS
jgi:hypothetical protein